MINQQDTWVLRVESAAKLMDLQVGTVDVVLKKMGLEPADLDDESVFKFADFKDAFSTVPIVKVRKGYRALRNEKAAEAALDPRLVELKNLGHEVKLEDADLATLLRAYRPDLPNDPVTRVLRKRFGDRRAIAFKPNGEVAVDQTAQLWDDAEQGRINPDLCDFVTVDGRASDLYPVGVDPRRNQVLPEDPLFPGHALVHDRSTVNLRTWENVPHAARVFCRLVLTENRINPRDNQAVLGLLSTAKRGMDALVEVYPEVDLVYQRLARQDDLPKLQFRPDRRKPNNPFGSNVKY